MEVGAQPKQVKLPDAVAAIGADSSDRFVDVDAAFDDLGHETLIANCQKTVWVAGAALAVLCRVVSWTWHYGSFQ